MCWFRPEPAMFAIELHWNVQFCKTLNNKDEKNIDYLEKFLRTSTSLSDVLISFKKTTGPGCSKRR